MTLHAMYENPSTDWIFWSDADTWINPGIVYIRHFQLIKKILMTICVCVVVVWVRRFFGHAAGCVHSRRSWRQAIRAGKLSQYLLERFLRPKHI